MRVVDRSKREGPRLKTEAEAVPPAQEVGVVKPRRQDPGHLTRQVDVPGASMSRCRLSALYLSAYAQHQPPGQAGVVKPGPKEEPPSAGPDVRLV